MTAVTVAPTAHTNGGSPQAMTPVAKDKPGPLLLDDGDFLRIVRAERQAAIGINMGDDIAAQRELALEYYKGEMADVPYLPGRSAATSTDISDAIWTAMPDLMDIFLGGEEIGSFRPVGEEDVEAAKQETYVVNHVIMHENDGFGLVHDGIHDALLSKVGVFNFYAEREEVVKEETFEQVPAVALALLPEENLAEVVETGLDDKTGQKVYRITVRETVTESSVRIKQVDPLRFAVGRDTVNLRDATYCVMQTTPRAQELKARGFDSDVVDDMPSYATAFNQELDSARDTVGEQNAPLGSSDATHDLRMVMVNVHVIRLDARGDGKLTLWRIDTDENEAVLLQKQELSVVPFAAGGAYRHPHRFYGRSLADILIQVQRIKTALTRAALDSRYFSLNRRHVIAEGSMLERTIGDVLNNTPGWPIIAKTVDGIRELNAGGFDGNDFEALEYFSTVSEGRTGIVRNAQGLNPDTLHDTAGGASMLMAAAQKRLRLVARTLAETLFKDLFVGVHALLREHGSQQLTARLRNQWIKVDPTAWGVRKDMTIEIGMGGGREHDVLLLNVVAERVKQVIEAQEGMTGPVVTAENVYNLLTDMAERAGNRTASRYFTDPSEQEPQQEQAPLPDPMIVKAQMDQQCKQQEMQLAVQMKQADVQAKQAEMAMKERHTQMQYEKDLQVVEAQQKDDLVRAQIEVEDKARAHELATLVAQANVDAAVAKQTLDAEKLAHERQKAADDAAIKQRELDLKQRELEIRTLELDRANMCEQAKLADAREARASGFDQQLQLNAADAARLPPPDRNDAAVGKAMEALSAAAANNEAVSGGLTEMARAMTDMATSIAKPKRVVRNKDGKISGVE